MRLVLDVENTITKREKKNILDPFEPGLELVQVGVQNVDNVDETHLFTLNHVEDQDIGGSRAKNIQILLDHTTLLIMHNAQHDLMWLWESGFKYDGDIYDTMLAEYLLLRGQKDAISLEACAERRNLNYQKQDTLKEYYKKGWNTNEIPLQELLFILGVTSTLLVSCTLPWNKSTPSQRQSPYIKSEVLPSAPVKPSPECICQESVWTEVPFSKSD